MSESIKLISLFNTFNKDRRAAVQKQFELLAKAYPYKCHHNGGYTDLWLCAIADIRDNKSPWL